MHCYAAAVHNPFPEELNRSLIGRMARWHFAPTPRAARHLTEEGVPVEQVFTTGNTVIDNLLWVLAEGTGTSAFGTGSAAFRTGARRVLVTLHRRENQGERMRGMGRALARLAGRGDVEIVLPLHKSPAVREALLPELDGHPGINPWEGHGNARRAVRAPWLVWAYTDPEHFYYITLKPNGWELGKRDPAYPGGQRFLATGRTKYPVGPWYTVRLEQNGADLTVQVGGRRLVAFTDVERPYTGGKVGAYTEDATVEFEGLKARSR
jgi:hypothetical protein